MSDLAAARAIADAVLDTGAYDASALVPPGDADEPSAAQTECLLEGAEHGTLHVRARFRHLRTRGAEPYGEAAQREIEVVWSLSELLAAERVHDERIPGGRETADGVTRTWEPLDVRIRASAERPPGPYGVVRLRLRLENTGRRTGEEPHRSLVAAHTLLSLDGGVFLSLADPPEWARSYAEGCENLGAWPVLIEDDLMLCSPVALADRPRVTPETPGHLFDAPVRPAADRVTIAGREVGRGSSVRLCPAGRADAQDMFMAGRVATVEAVLSDVDGSTHLAVTIDDDPGADLRRAQGRYWYFGPDDVEPL